MNNHIILSCHEIDHAVMQTLLAGMEAHSDFVATDMNALWRPEQYEDARGLGGLEEEFGPKPVRDAWHGFTYPDFPWKTLLSLLESGAWLDLRALTIVLIQSEEVLTFGLSSFAKAVNGGFLK